MLFKNNTMSLVTDINLVGEQIKNVDYVIVAGITDANIDGVFNAAILIPPTQMLMAWADGVPYVIQNNYPAYLSNCKEADDMIVSLLAALTRKNVVVYIPNDEFRIFGTEFLNHMYYTYGIIMNTPNTNFTFDITKLPLVLSKFYMMDLISPDDYLKSYPSTCALPAFVINKLNMELRPFGNAMCSFEQYANYFNNKVREYAGGVNINPIKIVNPNPGVVK